MNLHMGLKIMPQIPLDTWEGHMGLGCPEHVQLLLCGPGRQVKYWLIWTYMNNEAYLAIGI